MDFITGSTQFFQSRTLPIGTELIGWSALVYGFALEAPVRHPSCVSDGHVFRSQRKEAEWTIFDKRYNPGQDALAHLSFALRHEEIDLLILKRAFDKIGADAVTAFIKDTPTGQVARRLWFFYELLTGQHLDLPDTGNIAAIDALDPQMYFTSDPQLSKRHRVRDNLLGGKDFCPIIKRTDSLSEFIDRKLGLKAADTIGATGKHLIARAASFMLLADSKASFEIEGERPPRNRLERWGRAVLEAGKHTLNQNEIYRLHRILLGDDRFTKEGYRSEGVFLGERDALHDPLPEFIGARSDNVEKLMSGLILCNERMRGSDLDPVIQAAIIAFGFVYIHPLEDGNGRLHRCLIHHVLAERKFAPPGIVFPVSSVMLDEIDTYRSTLQEHSGPLMEFIQWKPTPEHNVEVTNDTADLYSYFDCTEEATFLYKCVERTIEKDLPREIAYLSARDEAQSRIMGHVEMPDAKASDLIMFIRNNKGTLPKRRRNKEFAALTDDEVMRLEEIISEAFADFDDAGFV